MLRCNLGFVDLMLWGLVVYLALHVPHIEMRMDDEQALAASKIRQAQQLQAETQTEKLIDPGPKEPRSTCFHMPRSECPTDGRCRHVDPVSVFCCDVDSFRLKEALAISLYQNTTNLHVLNATIDELNISQAMFRRLQSMAVTDGNIGQIVGQFPKHSSIACLNISNNNLTSTKLRSTTQRPFAYLFNMTVLDASANNLTEFPLSLVQSNRKISMDLSGNNHLQCSQFSRVMENNSNNASLVTFLNYDKTYCSRTLFTHWWFKEDQVIKIDVLRAQRELNLQCLKIRPIGINCTCTLAANHQSVSVDCSNQNLKEMPTNLPPYTENLNVSHNNISSLQAVGDDPTYEQVVQLSVDYNDIVSIVELEGTNFIDNFRVFGLSYNKLKYIHTYVLSNRFDQRTSQNVPAPLLFIGGNYINCDCNTEKLLKPWLVEYTFNIYDFAHLECKGGLGPVVELTESQVCHTPRDWTDYINFIIGLEVLVLVLLISKVSYDYWVFKTAGYLPWPANKMPRLPCDWLCE